jgi:hypothetical protein
MAESAIQVYNMPNGPQVYIGNIRVHHWQAGAMSAIIGALGLLLDDNNNRKNRYTTLLVGGILIFLHDLPDFIEFIDELLK